MVMVLEQHMVDEMARIGNERKPAEAAGVMLPFVFEGVQIIELPNRSMTPHDHFEMNLDDIEYALGDFVEANPDPSVWNLIVLWHTHPSGNVGPSKYDLDNRISGVRNLVISLPDEGKPLATWY